MSRPVLAAGKLKRVIGDGFAMARLIAACALFLAIGRWPYSYYQILRWAVCIIAAYGAFRAFDLGRNAWAWTFVALAVLFNPIAPIHFARDTWKALDGLAGIVLGLSVLGLGMGKGKPV
jgi:hypothetical protein